MNPSARKRLVAAVCAFVGCAVLPELAFRALGGPMGVDLARLKEFRTFLLEGHYKVYEPRPHTVYQHPRTGAAFNSLGFNDVEWTIERTPGRTRVLCIGASTTEGGNGAGRNGAYPHLLEEILEQRTGQDFEVMNAGMSGWTTAEMLTSWFLCLQDYAPDVVVIHAAVNDLEPRFRADFRPDYTHWRRPYPDTRVRGLERLLVSTSRLYLFMRFRKDSVPSIVSITSTPPLRMQALSPEGKLPPETARPFARNVASMARDARARGARVLLMTMPHQPDYAGSSPELWIGGILEHNERLRELAQAEGFELVDAAAVFDARANELAPEFIDLVHVQPAGNRLKAELVADELLSDGSANAPAR